MPVRNPQLLTCDQYDAVVAQNQMLFRPNYANREPSYLDHMDAFMRSMRADYPAMTIGHAYCQGVLRAIAEGRLTARRAVAA